MHQPARHPQRALADPPGGASGAAALVGVALCCPSAPAPSSAEAHPLRDWRDLRYLFPTAEHGHLFLMSAGKPSAPAETASCFVCYIDRDAQGGQGMDQTAKA